MPEGFAVVSPAGGDSPIMTWTRGGLTSMTGNDVKSGTIISRYDLEVAVDVAKGKEWQIGIINDTALGGL
jgi:hypothetical protein